MTGPDFEGDNKNLDNKTSIEEKSKPNRVPLEQNKNLPIIKPEDKPILDKDPYLETVRQKSLETALNPEDKPLLIKEPQEEDPHT